jgi:hypothetical protein
MPGCGPGTLATVPGSLHVCLQDVSCRQEGRVGIVHNGPWQRDDLNSTSGRRTVRNMDSGIVGRITFHFRVVSKLVLRWNVLLYVERRTRRTPGLATYRFLLRSIGESLSEQDVLFILTAHGSTAAPRR